MLDLELDNNVVKDDTLVTEEEEVVAVVEVSEVVQMS